MTGSSPLRRDWNPSIPKMSCLPSSLKSSFLVLFLLERHQNTSPSLPYFEPAQWPTVRGPQLHSFLLSVCEILWTCGHGYPVGGRNRRVFWPFPTSDLAFPSHVCCRSLPAFAGRFHSHILVLRIYRSWPFRNADPPFLTTERGCKLRPPRGIKIPRCLSFE